MSRTVSYRSQQSEGHLDSPDFEELHQGLSVDELMNLKELDCEGSELMGSMPVESPQSSDHGRIREEEMSPSEENGYAPAQIVIKQKAMTRSIFTVEEADEYDERTVNGSRISQGVHFSIEKS